MNKESALDIIREARFPESYELEGYGEECNDVIDGIDNEEELLEDFDEWKERNELFFKKVQDQNYWSSL